MRSATTTASVFDAFYSWARKVRLIPELRFVNKYHDHPGYIAALAQRNDCRSIAYTYSEPVIFFEYMLDTADAGRAAGVKSAARVLSADNTGLQSN